MDPLKLTGSALASKDLLHPPPSLENIYKEQLTHTDGFVHPGHGDFSGWTKQGVLLLNAVLTVQGHQASSHKE